MQVAIERLLFPLQAHLLNTDLDAGAGTLQAYFCVSICSLPDCKVRGSSGKLKGAKRLESHASSYLLVVPVCIPLALAFEYSLQSYSFIYIFLPHTQEIVSLHPLRSGSPAPSF